LSYAAISAASCQVSPRFEHSDDIGDLANDSQKDGSNALPIARSINRAFREYLKATYLYVSLGHGAHRNSKKANARHTIQRGWYKEHQTVRPPHFVGTSRFKTRHLVLLLVAHRHFGRAIYAQEDQDHQAA